jgi:hypothetical protein
MATRAVCARMTALLADMTDDPALAPALRGAAGVMHHLVLVVGPAANGMIVSSRQRLLAHRLRAGPDVRPTPSRRTRVPTRVLTGATEPPVA